MLKILRDIKWSLSSTSNFWIIPSLRLSKERKRIKFKNGQYFDVNWLEYCKTVLVLNNCACKLETVNGYPCFRKEKMRLIIPFNVVQVLFELNDQMYDVNFKDKIVLDIGGFMGDTAVYFSCQGAKRIVIYEPFAENWEIIRQNIKLNNVNAELHEEGIDVEDGVKEICYDSSDLMSFGLTEGKEKISIKTKDIKKVIKSDNFDIAKIDCEGAEKSLLDVPNDILRTIPFYIIEVHSTDLGKHIIEKFVSAGFELIRHFSPFSYYYPKHDVPIGEISVVFFNLQK